MFVRKYWHRLLKWLGWKTSKEKLMQKEFCLARQRGLIRQMADLTQFLLYHRKIEERFPFKYRTSQISSDMRLDLNSCIYEMEQKNDEMALYYWNHVLIQLKRLKQNKFNVLYHLGMITNKL